MIRAMKARAMNQVSGGRSKNAAIPTNLTLSSDARQMARKLKKQMSRPSISNVVETLILEKGTALGLAALPKPVEVAR
jgi:hypothetical protein